MKVNPVPLIISLAISGLISYGFYAFTPHIIDKHYILTLVSFIFSSLTLIGTIGLDFTNGRTTAVIRTLSGTFFFISLLLLILLAVFNVKIPVIIISSGILLLLYVLIAYSIAKSKH